MAVAKRPCRLVPGPIPAVEPAAAEAGGFTPESGAGTNAGKNKVRSTPTLAELLDDIRRLLRRDWSNIRDGLYHLPSRPADGPGRLFADALAFFADFPQADRAPPSPASTTSGVCPTDLSAFPDYYLRNFHYQTGGYLSELSASSTTSRSRCCSSAAPMRCARHWCRSAPTSAPARLPLTYLDVACGTMRFMASVLDNFTQLRGIGVDLSPHYLAEARRRLGNAAALSLVQALAEDLPFADGSIDVISCVYAARSARPFACAWLASSRGVLRPGGRLVLVDSLQFGDRPAWDGLLAGFPKAFPEPFYAGYAGRSGRIVRRRGLRSRRERACVPLQDHCVRQTLDQPAGLRRRNVGWGLS